MVDCQAIHVVTPPDPCIKTVGNHRHNLRWIEILMRGWQYDGCAIVESDAMDRRDPLHSCRPTVLEIRSLILLQNVANQMLWAFDVDRRLIAENSHFIRTDFQAVNIAVRHPILGVANGSEPPQRFAESPHCSGIVRSTNIGAHRVRMGAHF